MAKSINKVSFSKATISKENDRYIITEISKDDNRDFDLSEVIDKFVGIDGISLSIGTDEENQPMNIE